MKKFLIGIVVLSLIFSVFVSTNSISFAQKKYKEAPMLTELVKQGKLPPVEQRLPKHPFVVGPGVLMSKEDCDFEVGQYGGTIRIPYRSVNSEAFAFCMNRTPFIRAQGISTTGMKGYILESFKVDKENKVFTLKLREGLKWSDGYPVTTEDIRFTYEDVLLNDKLTPVFPTQFRSQNNPKGTPMKVEIIDQYTFRITFDKPYGQFLSYLTIAGWASYQDLLKPAHYLKQYHIRYTPLEKMKPALDKEKLGDAWWELFQLKDFGFWELSQKESAGFPTLTPWIMKPSTESGVYILERNPYFFAVDTEGNQLPYIDKIVGTHALTSETRLMTHITGQVDLGDDSDLANLPIYKENEAKGGYKTLLFDAHVERGTIFFNLTYPDPTWRKVVRDVRFRRAVSLGINRSEIIRNVYYNLGKPTSLVPSEYNPSEANRLLDAVGLNKRDKDGWRLGPDGKTFTILFESSKYDADLIPATELIVAQLRELGLKAEMKEIETSLHGQRSAANQLQATVLWCEDKGFAPYGVFDLSLTAPLWHQWIETGGKEGEEPPDEVKKFYDLRTALSASNPTSLEYKKILKELDLLKYKYIFYIPVVKDTKYIAIVNNKLRNVQHSGYHMNLGFTAVQYFFGQ